MKTFSWALFAVLLTGGAVSARVPQDPSPTVTMLEQRLASYRHLLVDWAGLTRYGSEDSEVPPPAPGEDRVVFIGDQITERWGRGQTQFFPGRPYFNRGIGGQTTPQMLVRFRQDVIALKPKVVVILAGGNDIAGVTGPATLGSMSDHIMSMTELAKAHGIRVVLASITPVCDGTGSQTDLRPQRKIGDWNDWIKGYAADSGSVYLDYFGSLANGRDFRQELTVDGLLPSDAGYSVMAPLAERAIAQALARR
jgi:lysophospholipase L1-like esterase